MKGMSLPVAAVTTALTLAASIAETVLASLSLHLLNTHYGVTDIALDGISQSSSDIDIPPGANVTFAEPWVVQPDPRAVPGAELATGVLGLVLSLMLGASLIRRNWSSRRSHTAAIEGLVAAVLLLATVVLFIYVMSVSGNSDTQSDLHLQGLTGGFGWDSIPTWEVWTCAVSSMLDGNRDATTSWPQWKRACQVSTGAKWTTLPLALVAVSAVTASFISNGRSDEQPLSKEGSG